MASHRLKTASNCTQSSEPTAPVETRRRVVQRAGIVTALLLVLSSSQAHAGMVGIQFQSQLGFGGLAGTPVWGSFFWNDTGPGVTSAPISALTLNVGNRRFNLSQGLYPAYVQSPHFDPNVGFGNSWGPNFQLRPEFMFGGLTNLSLFQGGSVFLAYSYSPSLPIQYLTQARVSVTPVASIPGPDTFLLGLAAIVTGWFATRRLQRRDMTSA